MSARDICPKCGQMYSLHNPKFCGKQPVSNPIEVVANPNQVANPIQSDADRAEMERLGRDCFNRLVPYKASDDPPWPKEKSTTLQAFDEGWLACLTHSPDVKALAEALEEIRYLPGTHVRAEKQPANIARQALEKYRGK